MSSVVRPGCAASRLAQRAGGTDLAAVEHDQPVAHPVKIGDQVRGQHHAHPGVAGCAGQFVHEPATGQGVEGGDRLVQDQQFWPLGDCHGERELGALPAGQLACFLLLVQAEPFDPCLRVRLVPARVQVRAELQVVGDAQPRVGGRLLRDEADLGELRARRLLQHMDCSRRGGQHPGDQVQER